MAVHSRRTVWHHEFHCAKRGRAVRVSLLHKRQLQQRSDEQYSVRYSVGAHEKAGDGGDSVPGHQYAQQLSDTKKRLKFLARTIRVRFPFPQISLWRRSFRLLPRFPRGVVGSGYILLRPASHRAPNSIFEWPQDLCQLVKIATVDHVPRRKGVMRAFTNSVSGDCALIPTPEYLIHRALVERDHKEIAIGSRLYIRDNSEVSTN